VATLGSTKPFNIVNQQLFIALGENDRVKVSRRISIGPVPAIVVAEHPRISTERLEVALHHVIDKTFYELLVSTNRSESKGFQPSSAPLTSGVGPRKPNLKWSPCVPEPVAPRRGDQRHALVAHLR